MPRTWVEWKREASILDTQWRQFNATHPQATTSKNPAATLTCSVTLPPSAPSSTHSPPMPPAPSSKLAVDLQPMDLDRMKPKNPPPPTPLKTQKTRHPALELPHTLAHLK